VRLHIDYPVVLTAPDGAQHVEHAPGFKGENAINEWIVFEEVRCGVTHQEVNLRVIEVALQVGQQGGGDYHVSQASDLDKQYAGRRLHATWKLTLTVR
jgi:hypothetical protein